MSDGSAFVQRITSCLAGVEELTAETDNVKRGHGAKSPIVRSLRETAEDLAEILTCIRDTSMVLNSVDVLSGSKRLMWSKFNPTFDIADTMFLHETTFILRTVNEPTGLLSGTRQHLRLKRAGALLSTYKQKMIRLHDELQWPLSIILTWQPTSAEAEPVIPTKAIEYLSQVRQALAQEGNSYGQFLDLMSQFRIGDISTYRVILKMIGLFQNRRDLIQGFNIFLPDGHYIDVEEAESKQIRITSPQSIELYSENRTNEITYDAEGSSMHVDNGKDAGGGNERAVNVETATKFINKVKRQYKDEPEVYEVFLETLQTYQMNDLAILDMYDEMTTLLQSAPDLIDEFKTFFAHPTTELRNALMSRFRYLPLDFSNFETRFLSIQPGVYESPITCELKHASLIKPPEYVALSYCWGDGECTEYIVLNGQDFPVTSNLEAALRRLRENDCVVVWADALCINQQDAYERSYQVARMGSIYSLASKVVAWLGEGSLSCCGALRALGTLGRVPTWDVTLAKASVQAEDILRLLAQPYWQRLWIVQEISKASKLEVWCGDETTEWEYLIAGLNALYANKALNKVNALEGGNTLDRAMAATRTLQYFCEQELASRRGDARMLLSMAMVRTDYANSTDPRDRVYALLGLARDGSEVVPVPNYIQEAHIIFEAVSRRMISAQGQISLILLAGRRQTQQSLPSWLPTWEKHNGNYYPWWLKNAILRSTPKPAEIKVDGKTLTVSGIMIHELEDTRSSGHDATLLLAHDAVEKMNTLSPPELNRCNKEHADLDTGTNDLDAYIRSWSSQEVVKWMHETSSDALSIRAVRHLGIDGAALLRLTFDDLHGELRITSESKRLELWRSISLLRGRDLPRESQREERSNFVRHFHDLINLLRACGESDVKYNNNNSSTLNELQALWQSELNVRGLSRLQELHAKFNHLVGLDNDDDAMTSTYSEWKPPHDIAFVDLRSSNTLLTLEKSLEAMELHSMKIVRDPGHRPYIVSSEARQGDRIYKVQNCVLPVLLRPTANDTFRVISEVVIGDEMEDKDQEWFSKLRRDDDKWRDIMLV